MKITHHLYNTFVVESGDKKIAIDPGGLMFYFFRFTTVIPESEWESITHIFVTHGDPDHYWHMDRVAEVSSAAVICNKTMARNIGGKTLGHLYLFWMIQIGFIIRQIKARNARPFNDILSSRHLYVHIHRNS